VLASRRNSPDCISDLQIDRLLLRRLSAAEERSARAHFGRCEACRARLAELEADARVAPPPITRPLTTPMRLRPRLPLWGMAGFALTSAGALLALLLPQGAPEPRELDPGTEIKGKTSLGFIFKRGGKLSQGGPGERLQSGDVLRFTYSAAEARYLTVVSVDGLGVVSLYFPGDGQAWSAEPGTEVVVPGATLLDDTVGQEYLYGFFCIYPIPAIELQKRVASAPTSPVAPKGCELARLTVNKVAR
jgi:hypothetical protein